MKKLKFVFTTILILLFSLQVLAQKPYYLIYDWGTANKIKPVKVKEAMFTHKNKRVVDFKYDSDGNFHQYFLKHTIIQLNNDEAIESYNKIYIPLGADDKLLRARARVIKPNGAVIPLDSSKIYTSTDEETKRAYTYFAFEGIEKGSIIDYLYVIDEYPNYNGTLITMQNEFPQKNVSFDVIAPDNLIFEFKSYNGLPEIQKDTIDTLVNHWYVRVDSVPGLHKEELAPYNTLLMQFIYQLEANTATGSNDITSYSSAAKNYYSALYNNVSKKEKKVLKKILKEAGVNNLKTPEEKILALENYIKTNINIVNLNVPELSDITVIAQKKYASDFGIVRLYANAFKMLDIKSEVTFTCNRFEIKFDPDFESYVFLKEILLYFPDLDKYTIPTDIGYRLGIIPYQYTHNYGLFLKEVSVGDLHTAVAKIRWINELPHNVTYDNFELSVSFTEQMDALNIDMHKEIAGYSAQNFQPYLDLLNEEDKQKLYTNLAEFIGDYIEVKSLTVKNDHSSDFPVKPFILDATVYAEEFIDKAGDKYLFKVGELIGPQIEMYQDKERKLPVELQYNHSYKRKITVNIPDGYIVKNLEKLNINQQYSENGEVQMKFVSTYQLNENILTIDIEEFYNKIEIPLDLIETYRKIINAAADFNKVVLIIEKK
jgi:hypothetical protein